MSKSTSETSRLAAFTADDVREILTWVPTRPGYHDWIKVISAVASVLDGPDAAAVLSEWSAEETPGEYARKLRSPLALVGIGSLIATAKANGFDASAFTRRRTGNYTQRPRAPEQGPRIIPPRLPPPSKKLPRYTARLGTSAELETLAELRGLGSAMGLDAMQAAGCLAFADDINELDATGKWHATKAWLVLDHTRRNVSARRLDGLPWNCCGRAKSRCLSGQGSKSWPVGITRVEPGDRLDVVEGEGDFLALWHLHAVADTNDATPVALLGSCTNLETFAADIAPYIVGRTVQVFTHRDRSGTGQSAALRWAKSFYDLGAAQVYSRNLVRWLGSDGKDLNDAVRASQPSRQRGPLENAMLANSTL